MCRARSDASSQAWPPGLTEIITVRLVVPAVVMVARSQRMCLYRQAPQHVAAPPSPAASLVWLAAQPKQRNLSSICGCARGRAQRPAPLGKQAPLASKSEGSRLRTRLAPVCPRMHCSFGPMQAVLTDIYFDTARWISGSAETCSQHVRAVLAGQPRTSIACACGPLQCKAAIDECGAHTRWRSTAAGHSHDTR